MVRELTTSSVASRRTFLASVGTMGGLGLAGCLDLDEVEGDDDTVQAAFVYTAPVDDLGFAYSHDQAVQLLDERHDWLETGTSEAVDPANVESVYRDWLEQGYDIIFSNDIDFQSATFDLAEEFSDRAFAQLLSTEVSDNFASYYGRMYQARYLQGIAAGMVTETDTLGFVGSFDVPVVIREINAFTLGAQSVNDNIETRTRFIGSFFDPPEETEATEALISEDADVVTTIADSPAVVTTARENEIWASGIHASQSEQGGDYYLTSPIWNWDVYYEPTLEDVRDDTFEADTYWGGLETGIIEMDDFGPQVPDDVPEVVDEASDEIIDGTIDVWEGTQFSDWSDDELFLEMEDFVEGVVE